MAVPYSATCISYAEYATKFADKILEESGLDATRNGVDKGTRRYVVKLTHVTVSSRNK
jgi:hypothetical protein